MKLAELQALFQESVLAGVERGAPALLGAIRASTRGAERATLFGVYQNAYRVRLAEFVAEDFPALRAYLGDDSFDALTAEYVAARPPRHRNARWFTTELPDFMAESGEWRKNPLAVSLAKFERALVDAFDAADAEPLPIAALGAFAPEQSALLAFELHPSVFLLELAPGTLQAYAAATGEEGDAAPAPPAKSQTPAGLETVAVWRMAEESVFRELEADEHLALNEARLGRSFGDICQMAAFQSAGEASPQRLAQFLANWFEDGMIAGLRGPGQSSNTPSKA